MLTRHPIRYASLILLCAALGTISPVSLRQGRAVSMTASADPYLVYDFEAGVILSSPVTWSR